LSLGERTSSIFRIIFTNCVANRICCVLLVKVSMTFCFFMSVTHVICGKFHATYERRAIKIRYTYSLCHDSSSQCQERDSSRPIDAP
ncbi:hypothetical protein X777_02455, partial [Ooceraea biroi]